MHSLEISAMIDHLRDKLELLHLLHKEDKVSVLILLSFIQDKGCLLGAKQQLRALYLNIQSRDNHFKPVQVVKSPFLIIHFLTGCHHFNTAINVGLTNNGKPDIMYSLIWSSRKYTAWRILTKMFNLILIKPLNLTLSLQELQRTEEQV